MGHPEWWPTKFRVAKGCVQINIAIGLDQRQASDGRIVWMAMPVRVASKPLLKLGKLSGPIWPSVPTPRRSVSSEQPAGRPHVSASPHLSTCHGSGATAAVMWVLPIEVPNH